jgi:hypothetical protein
MSSQIFYVSYFENLKIQKALDAIRILCNPNKKTKAHITLRGPYKKKYRMTKYEKASQGLQIKTTGVGRFINDFQNTVFISCEKNLIISSLWKKEDYADVIPHITLYDGDSRFFAEELFQRLSNIDLDLTLELSGLSVLISSYSKNLLFEDRQSFYNENDMDELIGEALSISDISNLSEELKLKYIEEIASKLSTISNSLVLFDY